MGANDNFIHALVVSDLGPKFFEICNQGYLVLGAGHMLFRLDHLVFRTV